MKKIILEEAKKIGIEEISFLNVMDFGYLLNLLEYRKQNGYDCEFENEDLYKRLNAKNVMTNCKTIISAIFPYAHGYEKITKKGYGNLSVSSFGIDYHSLVKEKLDLLCHNLKKYIDFEYKICVDTEPLIDRAICQSSGLGKIGYNSLLINKKYGSFVFLGYILTDLKIDDIDILNYENYINPSCSKCRICIEKCPNGAILGNGTIDTKKCISYLTQTKNYIPIEYRKNMGAQIYGCDECQINCPQNLKVTNAKSLIDYEELLISLKDILNVGNSEFKTKFGHMAGSWRGKNIWKRNAIIACANTNYIEAFDDIKKFLYNDSDMLKIYAAWAILELDKNKAKPLIIERLSNEKNEIIEEYKKLLRLKYE